MRRLQTCFKLFCFKGMYNLASFAPTIVNTSDQVVSRFSPTKRGCYNDEEFHLKTLHWNDGYRYSMKNCLYSSLLEKVFSNCSCIPGFCENLSIDSRGLSQCRYIW